MTQGRTKFQIHRTLNEKLALVRISRWLNLMPGTLAAVRAEIADALGLPTDEPKGHAGLRTALPAEIDDRKLNLQLRQMMAAGAPWHVMSDILWQDYNSQPTPQKAARLLETAFVHASPGETLEIFTHLMSSGTRGFYWLLHPKLRDFLVEHAPQANLEHLYWVLARERNDTKLSGIELTYIFLRVATTSDKTAAWMFFRRHQARILDAFGGKRHFSMSQSQLIFRAGELALSQGYTEDARELFLTLPSDGIERDTALQLLLRFESNTLDKHKNSYFVRVESTPEWQDRLQLISSFCDTCRSAQALKDPNRPALDILVASILKWVPKNTDAWRQVGELIVRHRDLASALPGLFKTFVDQAVIFHGPDIDGALWAATIKATPQTTTEKFHQCVGLLHKYVTNPRIGEKIFWQAHIGMNELESGPTSPPWSWRELLKTANQWINQTTLLLERDRKRAAVSIKLALEGALATRDTFDSYMEQCEPAPEALLHTIARGASEAGDNDYASSVLIRSGLTRSFSNKELLHIWTQASGHSSPDLAWRVATVLASRDALPATIKHTWEISGERRTVYTPSTISAHDIECALSDLPAPTKRLAQALCTLGQRINELAHFNNSSNQTSPALNGTSSIELAIFESLKNTQCIPQPTKTVIEVAGIHMIPTSAVPFAQAIINGPWLFAARLIAERLSMTSWGWSLTILQHHVKNILPIIGKDPSARTDPRMSKWIASMTSHERAAWNDVVNCSNGQVPENISNDLIKFVCRLAIIVYPGHFGALKAAQQIRMPLDILRDMEWFILCEHLTQLRSQRGLATRVAVPTSIKRQFN
jgi:hypothetical protein